MQNNNYSYTTFEILHRNIGHLKALRPDIYLNIHIRDVGYPIEGEVVKSMAEQKNVSHISACLPQVVSINTSIILNATAFFEGALETLLVARLSKIFTRSSTNTQLYNKMKEDIIRCSSYDGLKSHFNVLFECKIDNLLFDMKLKLNFIEAFYHIRHELAHASEIPTDAIAADGGGTSIIHNSHQYSKLFLFFKAHYELQSAPSADIQTILMFSRVIDDFSNYIEEVIEYLANELREKQLISGSNHFWDQFKKIN